MALVAGTYVLTDTINRSFDEIFDQALKGIDVVVTPKEVVRQDDGGAAAVRRVACSTASATVRAWRPRPAA